MSELERWASPSRGLVPSRDERTHRKAVDRLVNETKFAGLKVDAEAALTGRIMERAVDLDGYRRSGPRPRHRATEACRSPAVSRSDPRER